MTDKRMQILLKKIEEKNSWGKNELKQLMLEVMVGVHDND